MWEASGLKDLGGEQLFVPKMHAVLHVLFFMVMFGSGENARLGEFEWMHQPYVKMAVQRTRQWTSTFEDEVLPVADRIDAVLTVTSHERRPNVDARSCALGFASSCAIFSANSDLN